MKEAITLMMGATSMVIEFSIDIKPFNADGHETRCSSSDNIPV